MDNDGSDFLEWIGSDSSAIVFDFLDDPADLVRASAVSKSWRQFVITNGLSKNLCKRLCPEISHCTNTSPVTAQLDHSTFFQIGHPIYASRSVRFKMGYSKMHETFLANVEKYLIADDNYVWTYVSPEFHMQQENLLQSFKLPRPVLCIGGVIKIELIGRVQKHSMDSLFYICINHVQVIGRSLSPLLTIDRSEMANTNFILKYNPNLRLEEYSDENNNYSSKKEIKYSMWQAFANRLRRITAP
ncbi:hypothetical protein LUZ60_014681 [Juncus effusus]|nr:hypothetical protein LUZ60_014681 [Juncus effusus]